MTSTKTIPPRQDTRGGDDGNLESQMHKLKLQWIMARDDAERQRVSSEIRRRLGIGIVGVVDKKTS
ncbi:MAG TPA: hypothetical protein VE177_06040 [Candidatus Binatus sp.]|nr:hypothetical protein [Candidatus Binatus sp.]